MMEVEDIVTENKDLQKTMIQKDKVIEDMETQLERAATEAEVKLMKTVEKMRIEYQLMARSAVSTKMRKMTDYLTDRLRQQESLDTERDSSSQARQAELQDKLTDTYNELNTVRRRLKSTFSFIVDFFKLITYFRIREGAYVREKSTGYERKNAEVRGISQEKVGVSNEQIDQQQNL